MKTYSWYAFLFVLGGMAVLAAQNLLFVKATAQQPAPPPTPAVRGVQVDGKGVTEFFSDGTTIHRTKDGKVLQSFSGRVAQSHGAGSPFAYGIASDPESMKFVQEEMAAAQETNRLAGEYRATESDGDKEKIKTALREKLTAIFDLQQKRRAHEIEQIQSRLKRLDETMSKRDAAKKDIVDRRLEVLTGGIDELGWEDTFRSGPNAATFQRYPSVVPYPGPNAQPPATAPPAINPGADIFPSPVPVPDANPLLPAPVNVPALPGVAPAPAFPPTPAALPPADAPVPTPTAPRR